MTTEIRCNVCGKTFKTTQALSGHLQGPCGDNQPKPANTLPETRMLAKPGSLDIAIENLQVPMVPEKFNGAANIYWAGFNKGVVYGADTILAGIRAAQELSSLGIAQATPVIKMAQEMRQAEGQAAQAIAAQLGQVTMQSNQQIIGAIHELAAAQSQGQPSEMNPMAKMFFGMMQPYAQQAIGQLFSSLFKAPSPQAGAQPQGGQQPFELPGQPSQQSPPDNAPPPGMKPGEEGEFEEA